MRHALPLFDHLEEINQRISSAEHIALLLDFDGTISEIVSNPAEAKLDPEIRSVLNRLSARRDWSICIVSGRALADVRQRVALDRVVYVGNHGLEIESDSIRFCQREAEALKSALQTTVDQLRRALAGIDGAEVEDKGLTASVHFRRVAEHLRDQVHTVTLAVVGNSSHFKCREGKMVLEVRPQVAWHKGHAVTWIRREILPPHSLPIYVGDDVTDEDAFSVLAEGITVKVGLPGDTKARYCLADVAAVTEFLRYLELRQAERSLVH